jgi:hypothetical protein
MNQAITRIEPGIFGKLRVKNSYESNRFYVAKIFDFQIFFQKMTIFGRFFQKVRLESFWFSNLTWLMIKAFELDQKHNKKWSGSWWKLGDSIHTPTHTQTDRVQPIVHFSYQVRRCAKNQKTISNKIETIHSEI